MGITVVIDESDCTGCGNCVEVCPDVFELDIDEEVAKVVMPDGGEEDFVVEAVEACPMECISLEEDDYGAY